ncbi:hypothetical protein [Dactylosporangium sp. CA-233914]|uniref:hypothetical protein n=1 Tax=Dactylosporangium sp. CA-233914 TaxID=3239934 RepID=UPI003D8AA3FF
MVLVNNSAGEWLIVGASDGSVHAASDRLAWLLPLLERSPTYVVAALSPAGSKFDTPLPALLRFALTDAWGSYWPARALEWLESSWPSDGLLDVLANIRNSRLPQPLRHRALRLWRAQTQAPSPDERL